MRFFVLGFVLIALATITCAQPHQLEPEDDVAATKLDTFENPKEARTPNFRQKRATCDLLSPFKVGHAACAAHCIAKRFRGGWCDNRAVCNCRM